MTSRGWSGAPFSILVALVSPLYRGEPSPVLAIVATCAG